MSDVEASVRLAVGLAQDGMTRVTLVVPRRPGVLLRARQAARAAAVDIVAERVGTATITLRFSQPVTTSGRAHARRSLWTRLRTRFAAG